MIQGELVVVARTVVLVHEAVCQQVVINHSCELFAFVSLKMSVDVDSVNVQICKVAFVRPRLSHVLLHPLSFFCAVRFSALFSHLDQKRFTRRFCLSSATQDFLNFTKRLKTILTWSLLGVQQAFGLLIYFNTVLNIKPWQFYHELQSAETGVEV
jgi:hypothetical protein